MSTFRPDFLWGAATAPHQVEGNNVNSDWWANEQVTPGMQRSGDANDSYHRYGEDMRLLADAGLNAYRFGIEWARVEPTPGAFSRAELAHYRRMIDTAMGLGLTPVVTLHHFSNPRWFAEEGGWMGPDAIRRFRSYAEFVSQILEDVPWVCTINEPNMAAAIIQMMKLMEAGNLEEWESPTTETRSVPDFPDPDPAVADILIEAHRAARDAVKQRTDAAVGWSVASEALTAAPGHEEELRAVLAGREDLFLVSARDDDFIGVQSYTSQLVDATGVVPHPPSPDNTMVGTAYRPDAIGIAVRHTWEVTQGTPIVITENGIATTDDARRIAYTGEALSHLEAAIADGIDVRGYLHWSALDNFEWGRWEPTFGLIAVDRETFVRTPKPSLAWLGDLARSNGSALPTLTSSRV